MISKFESILSCRQIHLWQIFYEAPKVVFLLADKQTDKKTDKRLAKHNLWLR